jgi:hypothetical protein
LCEVGSYWTRGVVNDPDIDWILPATTGETKNRHENDRKKQAEKNRLSISQEYFQEDLGEMELHITKHKSHF